MFRPRKHIKLDALTYPPELGDLRLALAQAQKNRDSTVELPWWLKDVNLSYSLAVRADYGPIAPVWTLYEGHGRTSRVVWSAPFTDLELLKEVVSLTLTESTGSSYSNLPAQGKALSAAGIEESEVLPEIVQEQDNNEVDQKTETKETVDERIPTNDVIRPVAADQTGSQSPIPYAYFYPGYPYPIAYPYPYPPAIPGPQISAGTVPLQPGMLALNASQQILELSAPNPELFNKQKTFLLGQFFVDSGVITLDILNVILKLQEMIASGLIDNEQAVEQIKKARGQQSSVSAAEFIKKLTAVIGKEPDIANRRTAPLLGEILVKAEVISNSLLLAVLKMQEVVRSGAMTQQEACLALKKVLASGKPSSRPSSIRTPQQEESAVELLVRSGLISEDDKETAASVQKKHGGRIDNILVAAGKISKKTFAAAIECEYLLSQRKIKLEQVMIALNYCERSRVSMSEAIADLGWHHDLDL